MPIYSQMIKSAPRSLLRFSRSIARPVRPQRHFSTAPPAQRSRSWRNTTVRWALAIGGIYYYNTSNVFAELPTFELPAPSSPTDDTPVQTLESLVASRRSKDDPSSPSSSQTPPESSPQTSLIDNPLSLDEAEEEASQQGAFNEETGEINWDCPCLGGMAHGPCGEEFRAAFSCFIYSKEEPKGMECIDNFKGMQECFRQHPDIYGSELEDGEGDEGDVEPLPHETDDLSRSHSSAGETTTPSPNVSDGDVNEGDVKPPSSQSKEPSTTAATPSPEVDEPSEHTASTQKPAPEHPQVDEPSTYPQTPSDPSPQPPTSNPQ